MQTDESTGAVASREEFHHAFTFPSACKVVAVLKEKPKRKKKCAESTSLFIAAVSQSAFCSII